MTPLTVAFDALLGLSLLWLAWTALNCTHLFKAIVLFVAFGLLMALVWVRLNAPDIALAEATIGAGLTGALLLAALARLEEIPLPGATTPPANGDTPRARRLLGYTAALTLLVATGLGSAVLSLSDNDPGLSLEVAANLASSGVGNPVTAVLLNFRGYDTLLELAVLLLALLGVWSLGEARGPHFPAPGIVLDTLPRLLTPVLILVTAYLLWVGADAPGGAFQAGAVLAAAGVLLLLAGWRLPVAYGRLPLRLMLVTGPLTFVATALITTLMEGSLLAFPPRQAGKLILLLESTATLSIGVTLTALFLGGRPVDDADRS